MLSNNRFSNVKELRTKSYHDLRHLPVAENTIVLNPVLLPVMNILKIVSGDFRLVILSR